MFAAKRVNGRVGGEVIRGWRMFYIQVGPKVSKCLIKYTVCFLKWQPPLGQSLLIHEVSRSHTTTPQSVGLLWASDQPVVATCTWQHTTLTTDRQTCPSCDSNSCSQQAALEIRLRTPGYWNLMNYTVACIANIFIRHTYWICKMYLRANGETELEITRAADWCQCE